MYGKPRKHRARRKVVLTPNKLSYVSLLVSLSSNVRSVIGNFKDLRDHAFRRKNNRLWIILIQEPWVYDEIEDELINLEGFIGLCANGPLSATIYVNDTWCKSAGVTSAHSNSYIILSAILCKLKFINGYSLLDIVNIIIQHSSPFRALGNFCETSLRRLFTVPRILHVVVLTIPISNFWNNFGLRNIVN